jgi:GDP-mannose 6-dehydrogenase
LTNEDIMRISVFGLGYVGAVTCGCLANEGHSVLGVDVSPVKVDMINQGNSPVVEPEIGELVREVVGRRALRATTEAREAVLETEISFVAVGTPSQANGSIDLQYIKAVCTQIGGVLREKDGFHVIVLRSTMLPGSTRSLVIPTLEAHSGKKAGSDFGVCFNPEFLREGSSVYDFYHPPKTVISGTDDRSVNLLKEIYRNLPGDIFVTTLEVSEMVKYADNNFHAVKVTFANEIGMLCKVLGIDSHDVMDIFCKDTKLNLSPYYLRPGFAYGGSCLPKDVNALRYLAKSKDLETPLLQSLQESNRIQVSVAIEKILATGRKNIGVLGFSFKAGTDDLRGSPIVEVVETLLGKGCRVRLFDQNVKVARLMGANQSYVEQRIPHLAALMSETVEEVIDQSDLIIIGNKAAEFSAVLSRIGPETLIFDLVRIDRSKRSEGHYVGLAW